MLGTGFAERVLAMAATPGARLTARKDVMPIPTALPGTSRQGRTDAGSRGKDLRLVILIMVPGCGDTRAVTGKVVTIVRYI